MSDIQRTEDKFTPSAYVLRRYAQDMETNTRLIDGDIAPYLRKVAKWIEVAKVADQAGERTSVADMLANALKEIEVISRSDATWFLMRCNHKDKTGSGSVRLDGQFAKDFSKWAERRDAAITAYEAAPKRESNEAAGLDANDHFKDAKEHLAWLKKTASDVADNARIVGFEDCLHSWKESLRTSQPAPLSSNHLDHVRESLRGAASDCHVSLQPDQVRYITKATLDAAGVTYV